MNGYTLGLCPQSKKLKQLFWGVINSTCGCYKSEKSQGIIDFFSRSGKSQRI